MTKEGGRLRAALILLFLVSSALFAVGATVERHQHAEAAPSGSETSAPTQTPSETGGEGQPTETHPASGEAAATSSEDLFGVNPEAPWVVAFGVAASVLLALAVWSRDRRSVLLVVIVFGLLLAALAWCTKSTSRGHRSFSSPRCSQCCTWLLPRSRACCLGSASPHPWPRRRRAVTAPVWPSGLHRGQAASRLPPSRAYPDRY